MVITQCYLWTAEKLEPTTDVQQILNNNHISPELKQVIQAAYADLLDVITKTQPGVKISNEKNKMGKALASPTVMNEMIAKQMRAKGYYPTSLSAFVTDYQGEMEFDFFKDTAAIEVSFGKYSFVQLEVLMKAPLVGPNRLPLLVEILADRNLPMSTGPANFDSTVPKFERMSFVNGHHVPTLFVAIDGDVMPLPQSEPAYSFVSW